MGVIKFTRPKYTINFFKNPSVEINTTGVAARGLATLSRVETYARFGNASMRSESPSANPSQGVNWSDSFPASWIALYGSIYSASIYAMSRTPMTIRMLAEFDFTGVGGWVGLGSTTAVLGPIWKRITLPNLDVTGYSSLFRIALFDESTVGHEWFSEAPQMEPGAVVTTYVDCEQPGCRPTGLLHASYSERLAETRDGGEILDFLDDFAFAIKDMQGLGVPPIKHFTEPRAVLPGSEHLGLAVGDRRFSLGGVLDTASYALLIAARANLIDAVRPTDLSYTRLIFDASSESGGTVPLSLMWRYAGGLEGGPQVGVSVEPTNLAGLSTDPFWKQDHQEIATLDHNDTWLAAEARYILKRKNGRWTQVLGNTSGGAVRGIAHDYSTGWTYYGGDFTQVYGSNWRYFIKHDGLDTYPINGAGGTLGPNGLVRGVLTLRNGKILLYGDFTTCDHGTGAISCLYVALFDPVTLTFSAFGANGGTGSVYAAAEDVKTGDVVLAGSFLNWAAIGAADKIVRISAAGVASAIGNGFNNTVYSLLFTRSGLLLAGGAFTQDGTSVTTLNYFAQSTGTAAFTPVTVGTSIGVNGAVYAMEELSDGNVAIGGDFTIAGPFNASRIAVFTFSSYRNLGTGVNGSVRAIEELLDAQGNGTGELWIGGAMTLAGTIVVNGLTVWTGADYAAPDVTYGGGLATHYAVKADRFGNLWIGHDATVGAVVAGYTEVTNPGSAEAFPDFVIRGSTGAEAYTLTNWSIPGAPTVYFNKFAAQAIEVLTLHTGQAPEDRPQIESSFGHQGMLSSIIPGSRIGQWFLRPGLNRITCRSSGASQVMTLRYIPLEQSRDSS